MSQSVSVSGAKETVTWGKAKGWAGDDERVCGNPKQALAQGARWMREHERFSISWTQ